MFLLLKYTLLYTVVLMMVALGGMFSERSGIINIALEGIMVIGGLMGVIATQLMPAGSSAFAIVAVSVLAAAIAGIPFENVLKAVVPFFAALIIALMIITYVPGLSLFLVHVLR